MKKGLRIAVLGILFAILSFSGLFSMQSGGHVLPAPFEHSVTDTIPIKDRKGDFITDKKKNPFDLKDPKSVEKEVRYDPKTNRYIITEKIGGEYYRMPTYMTFSEYMEWKRKEEQREYFTTLAGLRTGEKGGGRSDPVARADIKRNPLDRLFGGTEVTLKPQGNIDLTFGYNYQRIDNPLLTQRQQRFGNPDFDMQIQMNVVGQIGEKLKLSTNYNTAPSFDFDRQIKLQYNSDAFSEDEILKKIEAGNVSLPLRSNLIKGSQSLFGIKTELQFGYLRLTAIASQSRSQQEDLTIQGGGLLQEFELRPDGYDQDRHFFLSYYNRNGYEQALDNLPTVNTIFRLDKIEVWITNDGNQREADKRFIVAFNDIGEDTSHFAGTTAIKERYHDPNADRDFLGRVLPSNQTNKLYDNLVQIPEARDLNQTVGALTGRRAGLQQTRDFEKVRARKLVRGSEYTVNQELGFISLNLRPRPDQIIAVSYSYSYGGEIYQVGEFASDIPETADDSTTRNVIFTKLLKNSTRNVNHPTWDLMMKNVYPLRTVNLSQEDFKLDLFYENQDGKELRYLPEMQDFPLVNLFNMDNLNFQGDPQPDGIFDFVPGITVIPQNGSIIFPVLEPFGRSFRELIEEANDLADLGLDQMTINAIVEKYGYEDLYNTTVTQAQFNLEKNRFLIRGQYKGQNTSEIYLGSFNLSPGSVSVRAGGQVLQEGVDYEIDYTSGRLRVLNDQYANVPINVSYEDRSLFSLQQKTMLGLRADYQVNKNLSVGATYMHLFERPFTRKVNIGDDPINNRIYGLDFNYSNEAPFLTKLVDAIPFIETKAESRITIQAEGAALSPGHSRAIQQSGSDQEGVVYLDDFEGITTANSFLNAANQWFLSSIPQFGPNGTILFPESQLINDFRNNANRAKIGWYRVENGTRNSADQNNPYTRVVDIQELFPNRTRQPGLNSQLRPLDIVYEPRKRGPYNFDRPGGTDVSAGLNSRGELNAPDTRWAGIMRRIRTVDFEAANYEYIEFWMLNPYMDKTDGSAVSKSGKIYIHLGTVSEDIIRDGRQQFENGLPSENNDLLPTTETNLARVPTVPPQNSAFDFRDINDQDLGLDGLDNDAEAEKFMDWLSEVRQTIDPDVYNEIEADPSNDDYVHFRDNRFDGSGAGVAERYSRFNNPQGNSQAPEGNQTFSQAYTQLPDAEDLNEDQTLRESENYFHYEISLEKVNENGPSELFFDPNDPNSIITETQVVTNPNGQSEKWYRFRVPITSYVDKIGEINDFRSIQFIRMVTTGFDEKVTFRLATFGLVRNQWRRYEGSELCQGDVVNDAILNIESVNIEENASRLPFNYVIPNGIQRERVFNTVADVLQNEQSLAMIINELGDGCAKAIFRFIDRDLRNFKRIKMFVHGESDQNIPDDKLCYFIRVGRDFEQNYYEYEIPLTMSDPAVGPDDEGEIWKDENDLDVSLEAFTELKQERNRMGFPLNQRYEINDPENAERKISIIGNPDLAIVRGIMIGVKNKEDDGVPYNAEVWVNELRLVGLEESGGIAGLARMDLQLADFGNVTLAANYNSIGWGAIDQRLAQRALEETTQFDATANLELGKFFPQKAGISIPFYTQFSTTTNTPKFDAYNRDLLLQDEIAEAQDPDEVRDRSITRTTIKSYNFTNVRKEKTGGGKPKPWDISNFTLSYGFTQTTQQTPILESDQQNQYKGQLEYRYSRQVNYIEPFKKVFKGSFFKFIKDFNFNLIPNSFNFTTDINRLKTERTYRFSSDAFKTWQNNRFGWNRNYALKWDLAKSLKIDFNAANTAIVDEALYNPLRKAYIDIQRDVEIPASEADAYLRNSLADFGRTRDYRHAINVSYNLPTRSFPILSWVNGRAQYSATYNWAGGSLRTIDSLGSVLNNSQNVNLSLDLNMVQLYEKWSFLKRVSEKPRPTRSRPRRPSLDRNRGLDRNEGDQKDDRKKDKPINPVVKALVRPILLVRQIRLSYTDNRSTTIPGFLPQAGLLGMSDGFNAPGFEFAAGFQPDLDQGGWLDNAAGNGWISANRWQNNPVIQIQSQKFDGRATLEPFNEFRIDITLNRDYNRTYTEEFRFNFTDQQFQHLAPKEVGSYSISYLALNTLFRDDIYELFREFEDTRSVISKRLADEYSLIGQHEKDQGYSEGFGKTNIDVLVPAFIGAYTGIPADKVQLDLFDMLPRPNWNLTYNGLSKIGFFKDIFSSFTISHGYNSTLRINSFQTDYDFFSDADPGDLFPKNEITRSFYSRLDIPAVAINEQFSPLIGINLKTKNNITVNLDIKRSRSLLLSTVAFDLNETKTSEFVIGFGYQLKGLSLRKQKRSRRNNNNNSGGGILGGGGGGISNAGTLNIKFDFSLRDDITVNHQLDVDRNPIPTRGLRSIRISPTADYALNNNLTLRLFLDYNKTVPYTTNAYPITNFRSGLTVRFTLN